MKTFRCKKSGNTVTFTSQHDIDSMRGNESYEEVAEVETKKTVETDIVKRKGRPPKDLNNV